jgi:FkbM family methyltransferase
VFEINPLILDLLTLNLKINLYKNNFKIFRYGLGKINCLTTAYIPKRNWGGTFILDKNMMSKKELLKKDGGIDLLGKNYLKQKVYVKKTSEEFKKIIYDLKKHNLKKGVIKIDIEGYELEVLNDIIDVLKKTQLKIIIIFECWKLQKLKNFLIGKKLNIYKITNETIRFQRKTLAIDLYNFFFKAHHGINLTNNLNKPGLNYLLII